MTTAQSQNLTIVKKYYDVYNTVKHICKQFSNISKGSSDIDVYALTANITGFLGKLTYHLDRLFL